MTPYPAPASGILAEGWSHLSAARWEPARDAFRTALRHGNFPEAHEGLSWAAWWLDDAVKMFSARQKVSAGASAASAS